MPCVAQAAQPKESLVKALLVALSMVIAGVTLGAASFDADARRLGGGRAAGMQRQAAPPAKPADATPNTPAQQNNAAATQAPAAAAAAPAAAAAKRPWMAPIAGLAAGLGIAALASYLGFGEALANVLTLLLLAMLALVVIRWLMRRFAGAAASPGKLQFAGAPATLRPEQPIGGAGAAPRAVPAGFDAQAFERIAKMIFIRLQAANDAGQVDDLRKFTTPELFASLRVDLQERAGAPQQTDVVQLDAQLIDAAQENGQWIATVRFSGLIREQAGAAAEPFDEQWHLVKPVDGSREWAIAGITPAAVS